MLLHWLVYAGTKVKHPALPEAAGFMVHEHNCGKECQIFIQTKSKLVFPLEIFAQASQAAGAMYSGRGPARFHAAHAHAP